MCAPTICGCHNARPPEEKMTETRISQGQFPVPNTQAQQTTLSTCVNATVNITAIQDTKTEKSWPKRGKNLV